MKKLRNFTSCVFSSFGQMIKPLIDSMSVRPAGYPVVSAATSSSMPTTSSREKENIFEPREVFSGATMPKEKENDRLVVLSLLTRTKLPNL